MPRGAVGWKVPGEAAVLRVAERVSRVGNLMGSGWGCPGTGHSVQVEGESPVVGLLLL